MPLPAGGIAAGCIGALTGFTQPVITAVVTGPAAIRLGVDPNKEEDREAYAPDGLHFNAAGHARIAELLIACLKAL